MSVEDFPWEKCQFGVCLMLADDMICYDFISQSFVMYLVLL